MSTASESPLRNLRLAALALCVAWYIISSSIGLNALIKSNRTETRFRKEAPQGVTLKFHINDLYQSGVVVTTVCAVTALLAGIFFVLTLVQPKSATGSLRIQAWIFTFFGLWLLATQIPYTVFLANRNAKIDAFLAGIQLPAQAVQAALAAAGESTKYSKLHAAVLQAIFPWIGLLSSVVLVLVLFAAARRRERPPMGTISRSLSQPPISDAEKADLKHES